MNSDVMNEKDNNYNNLDFLKDNFGFITAFLILWSWAAFLLFFVVEKGDVILYFAEDRTEIKNSFFIFCTYLGEGFIYVFSIIAFLFIAYSKSFAICVNALMVLVVSGLFKRFFEHERPERFFNDLLKDSELPNYLPDVVLHSGWTTSFPSGHTTSAFALFSLLAFFITSKSLKYLCLLCAVLVGVSRMYLVQHFLKDVTSGMLTGFLIALFVYWLHQKYSYRLVGKLALKK
jgi:membrane-associated phospholipid phosphatase